jgi:euchromatic histone-lysine N-methyltransferase
MQDTSNKEAEDKRAGGAGTNKAHGKIQESQVVDGVVPIDFAGRQHDSSCTRNVVTKVSPRHDFGENMNGKRPLHDEKHVALVARNGEVRRKVEESLREGTTNSNGRGLVDAKTNVKWPDDIEVFGDSTPRNTNTYTRRGNGRSSSDMKQGMVAKLKSNDIKGSLNRQSKESKSGNHDLTDQIEENVDLNFVNDRIIVQALMAPDKCPWTKGRKSSASSSLPPRSKSLPRRNNKKNDDTPRKELLPKPAPSTKAVNETIEDQEHSCSEDDDASMALVVDERKKEMCVTLPPCAPSGDQSVDARSKAKKLLKLFQLICRKLMQAEEQGTRKVGRIDIEAVNAIKKNYEGYTKAVPIVGNVPGVDVGDEFHFRVELSIIGLHRPYQGGIDTCKVNGVPVAISIVASGGYPDELPSSDELIYTGSGGKASGKKEAEDQELKRGNLALKNCIKTKTPVRVTHGFKGQSKGEAGHSKSKQVSTYTYDGLYTVVDCWQEGEKGSMVFKYKLKRIPGQPELALHIVRETRKSKVRAGLCCPDISQGKERIPICVINTIDDMQPAPFKYTTKVIYPPSYAKETPKGCDCTNGCSDSNGCACAVKNGGEIPFNFNGAIVHAKPLIYECGPSCR